MDSMDLQYMNQLESIEIFGVKINRVDTDAALAIMEGFIREGGPHMVVTADSSCVVIAQDDPQLRDIVNNADLITPDGTGILWAARRFGTPLMERVSGCDMVDHMCERGAKKGYRVFLLGSAPGIADEAGEKLKERYPGLNVVGTQHGFFSSEESKGLVRSIRDLKPDLLFVAMGIPRQEKWISENLKELGVPVCIGVGGTFDVISGRVKRAPEWMQRRGLEWVYRLVSDPKKIKKVMTLPIFAWMVIKAGKKV
jgi:N-acetylglucosaminyldiphosphoundecaprenol N-acetyl-beta-D-mannosaminyltransferase